MLKEILPIVGVTDLARAVAFWSAALDLVPTPEWGSDTWCTLSHADGSGRAFALMVSGSPPELRPRVHLDFFAASAAEMEAEAERLIGLGATRPEWEFYPDDPFFVVLADPDGNIFCIIDLSREASATAAG